MGFVPARWARPRSCNQRFWVGVFFRFEGKPVRRGVVFLKRAFGVALRPKHLQTGAPSAATALTNSLMSLHLFDLGEAARTYPAILAIRGINGKYLITSRPSARQQDFRVALAPGHVHVSIRSSSARPMAIAFFTR
jgi:hypothetical protein